MESKIIESFDKSLIFYQIHKKPKRNWIVFIHGWFADVSYWEPQIEFFKQKYNILVMDNFGHGRSDRPLDKKFYKSNRYEKDIKHIMDQEEIKNAHIVGHSLGGLFALKFVIKYPKAAKSVSILGGLYTDPYVEGEVARIGPKYREKIAQFFLKERDSSSDFSLMFKIANNRFIKPHFLVGESLKGLHILNKIKKISIPKLVIAGKSDTTIPVKYAQKLADIWKTELHIVNDAHLFTYKKAKETNQILSKFLTDVEKQH